MLRRTGDASQARRRWRAQPGVLPMSLAREPYQGRADEQSPDFAPSLRPRAAPSVVTPQAKNVIRGTGASSILS